MNNQIMMCCGYVESTMMSWVIWSSDKEFATKMEAVQELALDIYAKYCDKRPRIGKKCCLKKANKGKNYCSECGCRLGDLEFDQIDFMDFVSEIHRIDYDEWGGCDYTSTRNLIFNNWDCNNPLVSPIIIGQNAEKIMLKLLLDQKKELGEADEVEEYVWRSFLEEIK